MYEQPQPSYGGHDGGYGGGGGGGYGGPPPRGGGYGGGGGGGYGGGGGGGYGGGGGGGFGGGGGGFNGKQNPERTAFIGNIPFDATEALLHAHCNAAGRVTNIRLVLDHNTGKAKGFAFCEFADALTATQAIRNLNGSEFLGRQLRVDFSDPAHRGAAARGDSAAAEPQRRIPAPERSMGGGGGHGGRVILDDLSRGRGGGGGGGGGDDYGRYGGPGGAGGPGGMGSSMGMGMGGVGGGMGGVAVGGERASGEDLRRVFASSAAPPAAASSAATSASSASAMSDVPRPYAAAPPAAVYEPTIGSTAPLAPPPAAPYGTDHIMSLVKSLTKAQLLEILSEMKKFSAQNPEGAKQLLTDSPQVAQTLLHILILFGLVRPTDVAAIQTQTRPAPGSVPVMGLPSSAAAAAPPLAAPMGDVHMAPVTGGYLPPPMPMPMAVAPVAAPVPAAAPAAFSEEDSFMMREIMKLSPEQIRELPQEVQDNIRLLQQQLEGGKR